MSIQSLQARQNQLVVQRAHAKDIIDITEREMTAVNLALKELQELLDELAKAKAEAEAKAKAKAEASTSKDVLADVVKLPLKNPLTDNKPPEGKSNPILPDHKPEA